MHALRTFLRDHRRLAGLIVALALAMKALVPAGYMLGEQAKVLTVSICADASGGATTKQIVVPHSGKQDEVGKSSTACPYAALGMASLPGADAALLALALTFILALGFAPVPLPRVVRGHHLRPPLRGPPAKA